MFFKERFQLSTSIVEISIDYNTPIESIVLKPNENYVMKMSAQL